MKAKIFYGLICGLIATGGMAGVTVAPINQAFVNDQKTATNYTYTLDILKPVSSFTVSGNVSLEGPGSLARIVLYGSHGESRLLFEAYPLLTTNREFRIEGEGEETAALDGFEPVALRVQVASASVEIETVEYNDVPLLAALKTSALVDGADLHSAMVEVKIDAINEKLVRDGRLWRAGNTSVGQMTYDQKKKMMGVGSDGELPDLQGFEYYAGGIFEFANENPEQPNQMAAPASLSIKGAQPDSNKAISAGATVQASISTNGAVPDSWDWRNVHGTNWVTVPKYQGRSADCVAFAALGSLELLANLYFNQHLDLDLSEEDMVCNNAIYVFSDSFNYLINTGVLNESCLPYSYLDINCSNQCTNPNRMKISGYTHYINRNLTEDFFKMMIITNGPLEASLNFSGDSHAMSIIGYGTIKEGDRIYCPTNILPDGTNYIIISATDPDINKTYLIYKNSYGLDWGENGFAKIMGITNILNAYYGLLCPILNTIVTNTISCVDVDGDHYYNWGISPDKPTNCPPGAYAEKDADDSDPGVGPFYTNYCPRLIPVTNFYASDGTYTDKVVLSWARNASPQVLGYSIWRDNGATSVCLTTNVVVTGVWGVVSLETNVVSTNFEDITALPGSNYTYRVSLYNLQGMGGDLWSSNNGSLASAPIIISPPLSMTSYPGDSVSFAVEASGTEPLHYQWQLNLTNLSGATATNYTIASVAESNEGSYRCVVTNVAGAATSAVAMLTVYNLPGIGLNTTLLTYAATYGGSSPAVQTLILTNLGQIVFSYTNAIAYGTQSGGWFSLVPATGSLAGSAGQVLTGAVNSVSLTAGVYYATNTVIAPAATNSPQSISVVLTVAKASQAITFNTPGSQLTTNMVGLVMTSDSGLAVTGSVISGSASIANGTNLTFTGYGDVTIRASQTGDVNYAAATSVDQTFAVTRATATVNLTGLSQTYNGTARPVTTSTVPVGLPLTLTYAGNPWAPTNVGSYVVTGMVDGGHAMYQGTNLVTLTIGKASQAITNFTPANGSAFTTTSTVGLAAQASSGLVVTFATNGGPCSINGTNLTFTGSGSVSIRASQEGNTNWNPSPKVTNTFNVGMVTAVVTLTNLNQTYDGTARVVGATTVPGGLSVTITYNGSDTAPTAVGNYAVTGVVNSALYQGATNGTLTVNKAEQSITFPAIPDQMTTSRVTLAATADSDLAVSYSLASGPGAINGNILTFTGAGIVKVVASQGGNSFWNAAANVTNSVTVNAVPPSFPTGVSASDDTYTDKVRVTWNAVSGATGYQIFRYASNNSTSADQIGTATSTTYDDTGAVAGTTYYYWVKSTNSAGTSGFSSYDTGSRVSTLWYVSTNGNDANSGESWPLAKKTIQAGVDVSSKGDIVLVTNGTYVLTNQVSIEKGITVKSVNGAPSTIVNGNYPVTTNRCFYVFHTNAVLDGFTITNGYIMSGDGGGVENYGTVQNCTISGNMAPSPRSGGGVDNNGYATVQNCTISGNMAECGGGIYHNGSGTVENCTISGNMASEQGGGLSMVDGKVQNCSISGNAAHNGGGVFNNNYGNVVNCTVSGNTATDDGGGVYINAAGIVKNCTISGNTATDDGGGAYNTYNHLYGDGTVVNCTVSGNTATDGGGVYNNGTVQNCIVYYNENDDFSGDAPNYSCAPGLSGNGNISNEPCFYDIGSGYGTNHTGGNFRLHSTSLCINTGTNQDWMTNAVDIEGHARIIYSTVDMGAYEYSPITVSDGAYTDKIRIDWFAVSNASGYQVYRNTSNATIGASTFNTGLVTNYDDTTAVAGETYYYWVLATGDCGNVWSGPNYGFRAITGAPLAPTNATASDSAYSNKVLIAWESMSDATAYEVWRSDTDDFGAGSRITSPDVVTTTYDDTSATPGIREYYYWVKAKNGYGASGYGDPGTTGVRGLTPPASISATDGSYVWIWITWAESTGATSYEVWRHTQPVSSAATKIGSSSTTNFADPTASAGQTYYYWVKPKTTYTTGAFSGNNSGSRQSWAATVSAGTYQDRTRISWNAVEGATGYEVWQSANSSLASAVMLTNNLTTTEYPDYGITFGVSYYYWARATNSMTNCYSSSGSGYRGALPPTGISASKGTYHDWVRISWSASVNATGYGIYRSEASDPNSSTLVGESTTTSFNDTTVVLDAGYYFWVKATNVSGTSPFSSSDTGWSSSSAPSVPSAPTGVTASAGTYTNKIRITWNSVSNATGYQVWSNTVNNTSSVGQIGTTASTSYDVINCVTSTIYYFWVKSTNIAGASEFSSSVSGWRAQTVTAPLGVSASDGTYTDKVRVSWDASSGATSYEVWRDTSNSSGAASKISSPDPTGTNYDDTSATAGTTYYYWVKALNAASTSTFSGVDSGYQLAPPAAPVVMPPTNGTINAFCANWQAAESATSYWLDASSTNDFAVYLEGYSNRLAGSALTYCVTGLQAGVEYYYRARSENAAGVSINSGTQTVSAAAVGLLPGSLTYTGTYGGSNPAAQTVVVTNLGARGFDFTNAISYSVGAAGWWTATPYTGSVNGMTAVAITGSVSLTGIIAGTYYVTNTVISSEATNSPQYLVVALTVSIGNQTITNFTPTSGSSFATTNAVPLFAQASSGLAVTNFTVISGPGVISGLTNLMFTNSGVVSVRAAQAGDTNWNAAPMVTNIFNVGMATAVMTLTNLNQTYDGTPRVVGGTTIPGGLSVSITYNGSSTAPKVVGNYAVTGVVNSALYQGSANGTLTVNKADQAITFSAIPEQVTTNTVGLSATADSGLAVSFRMESGSGAINGNILTFTGVGVVQVVASQGGNALWNAAANVTNHITVNAITPPSAPTGVSASDGTYTDKVQVTWNTASGATGYQIFRYTSNNSASADQIGTATSTIYDDTGAVAGTTYYYWVKAMNAGDASGFSSSDTGRRAPTVVAPSTPMGVSASDGMYMDKVQVTWDASSGATGYEVWRNASNNIASGSNLVTTATTTYDDLTAATTPGTILYYWVKAVNAAGASGFSTGDSGYVEPAIGPTIKANGTVGKVTVNYPDAMSITIEINEVNNAGAPADWWVLSLAGSSWYYLNNSVQWTPFDGNLSHCDPLYQGALFNLPATRLPVLNIPGLPVSSYTFWFAVDSQMDGILNVDGQTLADSVNVTMLSALPAPCVKANGTVGEITVNYPETVAITIEMNARAYAGVPADWWVLAGAGSSWYYLDSSMQWIPDGNMLNWHPVYQGALSNLPATQVLNMTGLPIGSYTFWFAVDSPMDGMLNFDQMGVDSVNVTVQ